MMNRKIIHCDADCFYAAIEIRDKPHLSNQPVAVGGGIGRRGVIAACNYEARHFGIHSAMATGYAMHLCPELVLITPDMDKYRKASLEMHRVFQDYTDLIEPLSLDEAYLDVTHCTAHQGNVTLIAEEIRQRIFECINITVSAGIAPNKFLAKVASDWNKPNGLFVIENHELTDFIKNLPIEKLHGVGKITRKRLNIHGIKTCHDLKNYGLKNLNQYFGSFGQRLYDLSRGIDHRKVSPHRIRKSLSVEHTYAKDFTDQQACLEQIPTLFQKLTTRIGQLNDKPSTQNLFILKGFVKVKFADFTSTTLERIGTSADIEDFYNMMTEALQRQPKAIRLLGIGVRFGCHDDKSENISEEPAPEENKKPHQAQFKLFEE
jgi:DNA polymerase-4